MGQSLSQTRKNVSGGGCPCAAGKMFGGGGPLRRNGAMLTGGKRKHSKRSKTQRKAKSHSRH